jgi:Family of unknown function (DUF6519)
MATDVARLSFDPARHYTGVVPQQGRVGLEAEQNEQRDIDADERRKELLDIVGAAGTPDDGYALSSPGGVLTVGPGTMYVGGLRVELDAAVPVDQQPDWLDQPHRDDLQLGYQHVLLLLQDRDVTAVEDQMLYEPALGGPDGAARTRIVQRIEVLRTDQDNCAGALAQDEKNWEELGLTFDPATMELNSNGRLLVTWQGPPEPADPCEPSATGGYLGAENQLIRVQITAVDQAAGTFDIIWGYDDASMLYRVTPDTSTDPVLTLERQPVDDFHRPRAGQAVQALRSTAALASTDGVVEGYVAALGGQVGVLTAPYDPDTKTVQFPAPLPADYTDPAVNPQLYLRVWEELLTGNQLSVPIDLTGTGVQVTITLDGGGIPNVDDYWCIAVRPSTPVTVYPDRLLRSPQPPDGPRQWVCPLAVITWQDGQLVIVEDCRNHFPPLTGTRDDGCCTLEVHPSDAAQLQNLIDNVTAGRSLGDRVGRITVCFAPGRYELPAPLVLRQVHSNMTLRACTEGAVVSALAGQEAEFGQGLFILADADNITITGFEFELPQVPISVAKIGGVSGAVFKSDVVRSVNAEFANRYVSIAIRPVNCAVLEVTDCLFRFSVGDHTFVAEAAQNMPRNVYGIAIFAAGGVWGLRLRRNRFRHHPGVPVDDQGVRHILIGYLLTPTAAPRQTGSRAVPKLGAAHLPALLDDAEITDNTFDGITVPVLVVASLSTVRIWDNVIEQCYGGIWLLDAVSMAQTDLVGSYQTPAPDQLQAARTVIAGGVLDQTLVYTVLLSETFPLPSLAGFVVRGVAHFELDKLAQARGAADKAQQAWMTNLISRLSAEQTSSDAPAPAPAPAAGAQAEFNPPPVAADQSQPAPLTKTLLTAWQGANELQRIAISPASVDTAVWIERNDIDCRPLKDAASGPALFVYAVQETGNAATAIVSGNRMITGPAVVSAAVIGLRGGTVTGNIVGAAQEQQIALAILLIPAVAITGNVVAGQAVLPIGRPFPAPLDTWVALNTIIP